MTLRINIFLSKRAWLQVKPLRPHTGHAVSLLKVTLVSQAWQEPACARCSPTAVCCPTCSVKPLLRWPGVNTLGGKVEKLKSWCPFACAPLATVQ